MPSAADPRLLPRIRHWFGLSQTQLGYYFGLSKTMVSQVERGVRGLPLAAALPQAAFTLALQNTPAEPEAEAADRAVLRRRQRQCELRAAQVGAELDELPARVAGARRRLAALPILTAAFPTSALPPWLADFAAEARAELERNGATAQALLRARQAALLAEASELGRLLPTG